MKIFDTFKQNYTVERYINGGLDDDTGIISKGELTTFTIKASVDPTPAEVLITLPEGYRTSENYTLYTDTELRTASKVNIIPDVVLLDNARFRVIKVAQWRNTILKHYEIIVSKEDIDGN